MGNMDRFAAAAAVFAAGFFAGPLIADDTPTAERAAAAVIPVAVAGVTVSIDPKTGRLRTPTDAELSALTKGLATTYGARPVNDQPVVRHADGSMSMLLGTRSMLHSVARIGPDGKLEQTCVSGHDAARKFIANGETPAARDGDDK